MSADENRRRFRYFSFLNRFANDAFTHELGSDEDSLARVTNQQLELLPAEERDLIDRKYFAEQSVKEMAGDLQTSEKAAESRLTRAALIRGGFSPLLKKDFGLSNRR